MALDRNTAEQHKDVLKRVSALFSNAYLLYSIGTGLVEDGEELLKKNGLTLEFAVKRNFKLLITDFDRFVDSFNALMSKENKAGFTKDFDDKSVKILRILTNKYDAEENV